MVRDGARHIFNFSPRALFILNKFYLAFGKMFYLRSPSSFYIAHRASFPRDVIVHDMGKNNLFYI